MLSGPSGVSFGFLLARLLVSSQDIHVRLTGDSKLVVDVRQNKVLEVDGIKRCINVWLKCEL